MKKFDAIFDTGKLFRSVLDSMAYAGSVINTKESCVYCDYKLGINKTMQALIMMLLDTDTDYAVIKNEDVESKISILTYCKKAEIDSAHYIFVLESSDLAYAINKANSGTLLDPQDGATIIVNCKSVTKGVHYIATGPGIKDKQDVFIDIKEDWITSRNAKNIEFPLGIDLIFVDKQFNILSIPRTTNIKRVK